MARKVEDKAKAATAKEAAPEQEAPKGTRFIKNRNPSESFELNGKPFSFGGKTCIHVEDKKDAEALAKLAEAGQHGIIKD